MNAVDIVQLDLFLAELAQACVAEKDHRAEQAIRHTLQRQPDAAYLLVQRVLQLESALCAARARTSAAEERGLPVSKASMPPAQTAERRQRDPWWRQSVAAFAGTAFLFRSTEYLLGDRR